ncbi:MAG: hypothetical protein COX62_04155 [Deltaproteobacteria bacterium CG_4_10_14_0_2_um_filter_43_8]|nr:MAG: hypothetical protein COV43_06415 [Deltaproteobacteria bacterium CG11_big_fil_rev_8_21_14_0_20_42_23]PJA20720.1 MAG: hypothetical protein COX62_04155 [Deltaproteobacteria bacterium CG_4_10_14_0_2_um_filter_43_8]PJC63391.1 MAG: hypothetical protein CO021_09730 [Deltaproteobacteria bacterium CG_4_9_14_0_2_um_filter_42_21]
MNKSTQKKYFLAALLFLLAVGSYFLYHTVFQNTHQHEQENVYYTCSMHPQIKQDKPGNCPICGMRLIKKETQRHEENAKESLSNEIKTLSLSPQQQMLGNVATTKVEKKNLFKTLRAASIVAYDRELFIAEQEYISALNLTQSSSRSGFSDIHAQNNTLLQAAQKKLELLGISKEELRILQKTKKADESLYITSPGKPVWINASVYEEELKNIKQGQQVKIHFGKNASPVFGTVAAISPVLDHTTRTSKVRIQVNASHATQVFPEMFAHTEIHLDLGEHLSIPSSSVINTGTKKVVWVVVEKNHFAPRSIVLGEKADDHFIVEEGISEGEEVVSQGGFLLDSEAELNSSFEQGTTPAHQH